MAILCKFESSRDSVTARQARGVAGRSTYIRICPLTARPRTGVCDARNSESKMPRLVLS